MTEVSTAVLVLDFQNEFLKEGGKLYATVKDMIESTGLLKKVPAFVSEAR
jgi:nicotinamidase-related amidase